ncbi:MAG: sigma-70 family RNA polymerase sigma factor [Planctomycetota bacterium]
MTLSEAENNERRRHVADGDPTALASLFTEYRARLLRMITFRLDSRLRRRIDAEDILQEVFLDARKRQQHFDPDRSFFVWLRMVAIQTLVTIHHRHLGVMLRDASREASVHGSPMATSVAIADGLLGNMTSPSQAALRRELTDQLTTALGELNDTDREVLAMRHFEDLSNSEIAEALGIEQNTASIRYVRAIGRLKAIIDRVPGIGGVP